MFNDKCWGHGGRVVTLSDPTSEIGVHISARPQVGKMVGSLQYRTLTNCMYWFPLPIKPPVMV